MSKKLVLLVTAAFAVGDAAAQICSFACGNWPAKTIEKGTIEEALNDTFFQFATNCNILASLNKDSYRIPGIIAKNSMVMGFSKKVIRLDGDSASRLFSFMFAADDLKGITTGKKLDTTNYVGQLLGDSTPEPRASTSMTGYKQTCTSYLQAAIAGGLKVPMASVESALSSEDKSTSSLVIVKGIFESPLYKGISENSLEDHLKFWMSYAAKKSYSSSWRYLKAFEGVSVYTVKSEDRTSEFSIKAGANLGAASISSAAGLTQKMDFNSKEFRHFIAQPEDVSDMFSQAPLPSAIAELFNGRYNAPSAERKFGMAGSASELVVFDGDDFEYWYDIPGLNRKICDGAYWEGANKKNISYGISFNESTGQCRFIVHGTTQELDFSQPTIGVDAVFQSKQALKDSSKDAEQRLTFVASAVARTSLSPQFVSPDQPIDSQLLYNGSGAVIQTQWSVPFSFQDNDRSWDRTKRAGIKFLASSRVACPVSGRSIAIGISGPQADLLTVVAKSIPASTVKDEVCQLESEVTLPLSSGKSVKRLMKAALKLP